jgi:TonB-dependent SusC/RagA subfamily outer membrane receptor
MKAGIVISILVLLFCPETSFPQKAGKKITISGKVTDAAGNPVPNAMIFIDNAKTDKVTNSSGFYRIRVKPETKFISVLSMLNGLSEEPVGGRTKIDFKMTGKSAGNSMKGNFTQKKDEINIGYGTVEKKNSTMQTSRLEGRQNIHYDNIYEMIRGQIPGVEVNGKSIRIAGADSFMLSTEPLYVVDGMTVETIDGLNPAEVKSIVVLKGPSASIYGSRGANGVIVITLISGQDR